MPQDSSLRRRLYTGESVQQARQAVDALGPGTSAIPRAASPEQQALEARVFLGLLEFRDAYTRFPLGIAAVRPEPECVSLRVESEERAAEILFNLLPAYVSDNEVHGVPGLRIMHRGRTAVELQVLDEPARLRLTGLPARIWRRAMTRMLEGWSDPDAILLCWQSSPRSWTSAEIEHRARWDDASDHFAQVQQRGSWLGSGLLRRAALLHTVSNTFFLDGYRGASFDVARLVLRSSHAAGQGPGPHHIVAALSDPTFGLPLCLKRFRGDTDEGQCSDHQFVLGDTPRTALLDLRAATERPSSRMSPETWQSILRRLPQSGFTRSLSPSVLAELCGVGAA